jgi:hypothetical protein
MANTHVLGNNKVLKHWVQASVMANPDASWGKNYGYRFKPSVDDDLIANSEAVTESPMYAAHPGYKYRRYGKRSADAEPETEANAGIPQLYYGSPYRVIIMTRLFAKKKAIIEWQNLGMISYSY